MTAGTLYVSHPRLPRWAPALVGCVALALAGLPALLSGWGVVAWAAAAAASYVVGMPLWSALVEAGRRSIG